MGVVNPNSKWNPYNIKSLNNLVKNRLWDEVVGQKWTNMRDIFLEPIIENLIRRQMTSVAIDNLLGRGRGWTRNYVKSHWGMSFMKARMYFQNNYLGLHEVNDYLD